ncbi:MAG: Clp1/GlmU family protein [Candidatus Nezhaarchaeota archaeon]|nr:Clp1/GlmU family protein [Candidatus Nezhaarchaeota archaeon]
MAHVGRVESFTGYFIAEGPLRIKLTDGSLEVSGKSLKVGEEVVIPAAKATLMESPHGARVEVRGGGSLTKLEQSTIPKEWLSFMDVALKGRRLVIALGHVDSGKTFFITYTANKLFARGLRVSVVDCDVGQSNIGPPTTIGLGVLDRQVPFLDELHPTSAYFVGSTSPAGHLLPMVVGSSKLINEAKRVSDVVLVDTPGMVYGGPARAYQLHLVESISPDVIVALQRSDELKHLTNQFKALGYEVVELPASPWVRQRDREDRRMLRERAFYNYFTRMGVVKHVIDLDKVAIIGSLLGSGHEAPQDVVQALELLANCKVEYCELSQDSVVVILSERPREKEAYVRIKSAFDDKIVRVVTKGFERGLVVGLMGDRGVFLDIGVLKELDIKGKRATIATSLRCVDGVRAIKLGCIRLDDEYREVERLEPGYI